MHPQPACYKAALALLRYGVGLHERVAFTLLLSADRMHFGVNIVERQIHYFHGRVLDMIIEANLTTFARPLTVLPAQGWTHHPCFRRQSVTR